MKWIKCSDRTPGHDQEVIVSDRDGGVLSGVVFYDYDTPVYFYGDPTGWSLEIKNVTHWMPLPPPPEE